MRGGATIKGGWRDEWKRTRNGRNMHSLQYNGSSPQDNLTMSRDIGVNTVSCYANIPSLEALCSPSNLFTQGMRRVNDTFIVLFCQPCCQRRPFNQSLAARHFTLAHIHYWTNIGLMSFKCGLFFSIYFYK